MNSNKRLHLSSVLIFLVTGSIVSELHAQGRENGHASFPSEFTEALLLSSKCRCTPFTKVALPIRVKEASAMKVTQEQLVFTYIPVQPEEDVFFVQVLVGEKDDSVKWFDATILGSKESPEEYYKSNYLYCSIFEDVVEYMSYLDPGIELIGVEPVEFPDGTIRRAWKSHGRVLVHLCGWVRYFGFKAEHAKRANQSKDMLQQDEHKLNGKGEDEHKFSLEREGAISAEEYLNREAQFLLFILEKTKSRLLESLPDKDFEDLELQIKFFDRHFPFAVFDTPLPLDEKQKEQCKKFFETTLYIRNRLKVFGDKPSSSSVAVARDRKIISALSE